MESNSLCNSLLKWLETFPGREGTSVPQLTDGVVMATVLHQIAPEYFSQFWLAKIKEDVGDNWRLKVSNLRKVLQGIVDYFQEQLNQNIKHFPLPDLNKIGEHNDTVELGRMLQLILGCAVNCESKQQYIEAIMNMEERVQKVIMEAIQELMLRESSPGILGADGDPRTDLGPASFHPHIKTVLEQLEAATQTKDEMMQRCLELEQQLSVLNEEKSGLAEENEKLLNRLDALETGGDLGTSTLRYKDLKKQIDGLQDELYKLETSRDEYRTKAEVLERENQEVQARNEELQQLADEARSLKDEVDALREMSERAVVYEGTMETYKKKLEELSDLKRQVRILEEKNSDYMQHNMELEEEVKKSGTWRPQLDLYKKQVAELHQKLADEAKKTDRQIFENKKLAEKMEAITQEKDRLTMERDQLKESLEELRCHISTLTSPDTTSRPPSDLSDVDLLEVIPHDIRQKLIRLQHENSMLKQRAAEGDSSEQLPVLQTLVSDLQERQNSLTQENRQLNHRIMELESEVEEAKASSVMGPSMAMAAASPSRSAGGKSSDLDRKMAEQSERIASLEESLAKKESEMAAMEERYKKYLGKAKSVIKTLDPKHNPALVPDVSNLRSTIHEKERIIENLERENEKTKMIRDMEEKLITTAFYNFGMQMHRQMISQRLTTMDQGQSFLSRQRQASSRRVPMGSNVGNRHTPSSSQFEDMRIS
ncbi:protein Hook homolog 3-like isoform X1 [Penaeus japonicus]|uniref:protein Hook homolog 3-like isoform X1 n=1 Tax=Penaeus japonicus TaxID=27405 RepID=UPI001C70E287|nr:protein Hook homolog 3-like isoform X1 [Penaeus japonicus]